MPVTLYTFGSAEACSHRSGNTQRSVTTTLEYDVFSRNIVGWTGLAFGHHDYLNMGKLI